MIKNILKLSIATVLLLSVTVVGMDADAVPALTGESDVSPRPSAGGVVAAEVPAGTGAQTHRIPVGNRAAW
jgi:hypothetical protein